jgi:hypothetical protein
VLFVDWNTVQPYGALTQAVTLTVLGRAAPGLPAVMHRISRYDCAGATITPVNRFAWASNGEVMFGDNPEETAAPARPGTLAASELAAVCAGPAGAGSQSFDTIAGAVASVAAAP